MTEINSADHTVTEQQVSEQHDENPPIEVEETVEEPAVDDHSGAVEPADPAEPVDPTDPAEEPVAEGDPAIDVPATDEATPEVSESDTATDETTDETTGETTGEVSDESVEDPAEETAEEPAAADPLEAFRNELWAKPGDWFVIHTYSGMEKRVKSNLENRINSLNMEDYIHEVVVPTEDVPEIKNGQRKMVNRTRFAGYVLVRMDLTDESWAAVRHTPSVTGFVGHAHQPVPLSMDEVENWLAPTFAAAEAEAVRRGRPGPVAAPPRRSARSRSPTSTCPTPSWWSTVRSPRSTRRSPRSTPSPRGSRPWSRSSAGRPRSSSASARSRRSEAKPSSSDWCARARPGLVVATAIETTRSRLADRVGSSPQWATQHPVSRGQTSSS